MRGKRNDVKQWVILLGGLLMITVAKFYEELIFILTMARFFREIQMVVILLLFLCILQMFYTLSIKWVSVIGIIESLYLISYGLLIQASPFIQAYQFSKPIQQQGYIYLIVVKSLFIVIGGIKYIFFTRSGSKYEVNKRRHIGSAILLPIIFYDLWLLYFLPREVEWFYVILLIAVVGVFIWHVHGEIRFYSVAQLIENIQETVLLFDQKGHMIYDNKTEFAKLLNKNYQPDQVLHEALFSFFQVKERGNIKKAVKYQLELEEQKYFIHCRRKEIIKDNKVVGQLVVIEDMTYLEEMLEDLARRTELLKEVEKRLLSHTEVVARMEEEAERNKLMLEVQNYLGHRFVEIAKVIENIIEATKEESDDQVLKQIKAAIGNSRKTLEIIRKTVIDYRTSYNR